MVEPGTEQIRPTAIIRKYNRGLASEYIPHRKKQAQQQEPRVVKRAPQKSPEERVWTPGEAV